MKKILWQVMRIWWWLTGQKLGPVVDARTVAGLLGLQYTEEQLAAFGAPPLARPRYFTYWDPGLSVRGLSLIPGGEDLSYVAQGWAADQPFITEAEPPRYRQFRIAAIRGGGRKTFPVQKAQLRRGEEVAPVRQAMAAMVIYRRAMGSDLLGGRTRPDENLWLGSARKF